MDIGTLYRFTFTNIEKACEYMRGWYGKVDFNLSIIKKQGYIDLYSYNPEKTAEKFGGAIYKKIEK